MQINKAQGRALFLFHISRIKLLSRSTSLFIIVRVPITSDTPWAMPSTLKIEFAQSADIPALNALLNILFTQEKAFTPDHDAQQRGLTRIINTPETGRILVARDNDQVVGMLNMLFTVSTALGESVVILEDMVVAPQARQQGTGSKLLKAAIEYARHHGYARLSLLTDDDNSIARGFYEKHGFSQPGMIPMQLILNPKA